jgi:hypothetical protein
LLFALVVTHNGQGGKMNANHLVSRNLLVFKIIKIKSLTQLRDAFRHNKREIVSATTSFGHIDPQKTRLNYSLTPTVDSTQLLGLVNDTILDHQAHIAKQMRCNAVLAIEVLFSVSAANTSIDLKRYFEDCLAWSVQEFTPAKLLCADVHHDEENPHMHIIFLCVTHTNLVASDVVGYKGKSQDRLMNFYSKVAKHHGLDLPLRGLNKANRKLLADWVIEHFDQSGDPITLSKHYPSVREAIKRDPILFAFNLDVDLNLKPIKLRTVAQIFTSKGKGSSTHDLG